MKLAVTPKVHVESESDSQNGRKYFKFIYKIKVLNIEKNSRLYTENDIKLAPIFLEVPNWKIELKSSKYALSFGSFGS